MHPVEPRVPPPPHAASDVEPDRPATEAPQPARHAWYHKLGIFLFVIVCFEVGAFLAVFPWTPQWDVNSVSHLFPFLRDVWGSSYFRGALSGLGLLNIYIYHPEQRSNYGDHFFPNGDVQPNTSIPNNFGPTFVARPNVTPDLGRWYEYEVMLKANTVGQRDGRVTIWLDGQVIGDFPNIRFRDVDTLKIDRFNLSLHAGSNPTGPTKKWYDNVVAAKSYIGPMVAP